MAQKIKKTYLDLTAYIWRDHKELKPDYVASCKKYLKELGIKAAINKLQAEKLQASLNKPQAASDKQQASSLDKTK